MSTNAQVRKRREAAKSRYVPKPKPPAWRYDFSDEPPCREREPIRQPMTHGDYRIAVQRLVQEWMGDKGVAARMAIARQVAATALAVVNESRN